MPEEWFSFWYYLFTGTFEAAMIHYAVAKIFGPLLFGRGWCGYLFVAALFLSKCEQMERILFWAFLSGNAVYYAVGIALAFAFRDNRAFCKYICPVTVFLKPSMPGMRKEKSGMSDVGADLDRAGILCYSLVDIKR